MILGAALLVLIALGLFVGGIATGVTAFYWACVALSLLAAALLFVARRRMGTAADEAPRAAEDRPAERPAAAITASPPAPAAPPEEPADEEPAATPAVEPAATPAATPAVDPAGSPEAVARHRSEEEGEGRVSPPEPGLPAGRVAGATTAGVADERAGGAVAEPSGAPVAAEDGGEPPVEEVEVTDLLLVVDLDDEVLVVDEHPRYHVEGCPWLAGRTAVPLPLDEARTDGFTPCGRCAPDRHLAGVERARRAQGRTT